MWYPHSILIALVSSTIAMYPSSSNDPNLLPMEEGSGRRNKGKELIYELTNEGRWYVVECKGQGDLHVKNLSPFAIDIKIAKSTSRGKMVGNDIKQFFIPPGQLLTEKAYHEGLQVAVFVPTLTKKLEQHVNSIQSNRRNLECNRIILKTSGLCFHYKNQKEMCTFAVIMPHKPEKEGERGRNQHWYEGQGLVFG